LRELLYALNEEVQRDDIRGELFLAGGAVMCLVFHTREAIKDSGAGIRPNCVVDHVRNLDVAPTIAALLGVRMPADIQDMSSLKS
jgi:hypothetical protein